MIKRSEVQEALNAGGGLLRLEPSWVPRSFMVPGRRLKLHPDDVYALGHRGGINERWVCYGTPWYSAKELTVQPKRRVTIKDGAAYGIIVTQGYGRFGKLPISTPSMIRFGQMTEDELFVSADAAAAGVTIENVSESDPLVLLKHFGPGNPDAEPLRAKK